MAVRVPEEDPYAAEERVGPAEPALLTALTLALLLFVALLANGRPSVAEPPARPPALRAALPADEMAAALAGKAVASLVTALAAGVLFIALARRWREDMAATTAALFVLGTPVWAASQALWPQPVAVLLLAITVLFVLRAEYEPAWAGRAGLPLGLALAVNPIDAGLVAVLAMAIAARWPRRALSFLVLGAAPVVVGLVARGAAFSPPPGEGLAARFGLTEPFGAGASALLASPGKGLVVFAPVAIVAFVGAALAFRSGERWLAGSFAAGVIAHAAVAGSARGWASGDAWGPRLMADAMPLLMLFVPEGLSRSRGLGWALMAASVAVQALGAFAYDDRWVRLWQRPPAPGHAELWDAAHSPVAEYARRRVVILAVPSLSAGRVVLRTHPLVPFSPQGSRVEFAGEAPVVGGADATLRDVHLFGGARVEGGRLRLARTGDDGLFARVPDRARARPLELRLAGRGEGALRVGESGFWNPSPRWKRHPASGAFVIRHAYRYPESGGPDLRVMLAPGSRDVELEWVALVPPGEPVNPLRLPRRTNQGSFSPVAMKSSAAPPEDLAAIRED